MLRRSTKVQLVLFVVITVLGISYVSAQYVGLTKYIVNNGCTVHAFFTNSGGIFTNAEVTYRGVTVGQVGDLKLVGKDVAVGLPNGGVQVDLKLNDCSSPKIPVASTANIHNRSVVGEQYVDLVPMANAAATPGHLGQNASIVADRTSTPVPTQNILLHLDELVKSVPLDSLSTTVTELYNAVAGRGPDLGSLIDSTSALLATATESDNLAATLRLIEDSSSVLKTQLDEAQPLASWTRSLNLLSQQLKSSDPDIRRLLNNGPTALATVNDFIKDNQTDIGVVLANLSTVGNMLVAHRDGIEQVLELYPALAAGGQSFLRDNPNVPGKRYGMLGLVLQAKDDPKDCGDPKLGSQGYGGTTRRYPGELTAIAPNVTARCTAPVSSGTNVRGSANVPGGDPISNSGGGYAYPRAATANTVAGSASTEPIAIGPSFSASSVVNDGRYLTMLTASLG